MRSMLNGEGIFGQLREKLWAECAKTATLLNNVLAKKKIHSGKDQPPQSPYQVFYRKLPNFFFGSKGVQRNWNFKNFLFETTVETSKQG